MKTNDTFKLKTIMLSVIILGLVASFLHFEYEFSGGNKIIASFVPVNESVWEHLKFMYFPLIVWWTLMYFINKRKFNINLTRYISASTISSILSPLLVILFFYGYQDSFGKDILAIDILMVFIVFWLVLLLGNHLLKNIKDHGLMALILLILNVVIFISFIVFTFYPPHLPIFMDTLKSSYGIIE